MTEPRMVGVREFRLDEIDTGDRVRPVGDVSALMESLRDVGLLHPITVRKLRGGGVALIAGAHRMAAARALGWETIQAAVWDVGAEQARLMEVEENLQTVELEPLDLALHLREQRRLYQKIYPQTRRGLATAASRLLKLTTGNDDEKGKRELGSPLTDALPSPAPARAILAEKRGITERQIQKYLSVGVALDPSAVALLRQRPVPPTLRELGKLAELVPEEQQRAALGWAQGGPDGPLTLDEAVAAAQMRALPPAPSKEVLARRALDRAWAHAPKAVKRAWLAELAARDRALLQVALARSYDNPELSARDRALRDAARAQSDDPAEA